MEINSIVLSGNVVHKPEFKITSQNLKISNFRLASNRGIKEKKSTIFINVVAFNNLADSCFKYLDKGDSIIVNGIIQMKQSQEYTNYEIIANEIKFLKVKSLSGNTPDIIIEKCDLQELENDKG